MVKEVTILRGKEYLDVDAGVQMPICICQGHKLWRYTLLLRISSFSSILKPLQEDVYQTVLLQAVITRAIDDIQ
jgi:hypothetical protein